MTNDDQTSRSQPRWRSRSRPGAAILSLLAVAALAAAGCGGSASAGSSGSSGAGPKIALLLPENQTPRYEAHDRPDFEKRVKQLCSNCQVVYENANGDAAVQYHLHKVFGKLEITSRVQLEGALSRGNDELR